MDEEAAKPRDSTVDQQRQYYYGTFQGVANYHPPAPPPQLQPLPQHPIATTPLFHPGHGYQNTQGPPGGGFVNCAQGFPVVPEYTVVEVRQMREHHDIPCCGFGMGWFLFIMGFLFGGIPWYLGAFIILCTSVDHREKAGYVACAIAAVVYSIAVMLGMAGNVGSIW